MVRAKRALVELSGLLKAMLESKKKRHPSRADFSQADKNKP